MGANKKSRSSAFYHTRLLCIISIAMVLLVLGGLSIVEIAGKQIKKRVQEDISFRVLLDMAKSEQDGRQLTDSIRTIPFVASATYISANEAANELSKRLGENPAEVLGYNPLQAEIDIRLKSDYAHPDSLPIVDKQIKGWPGVASLSYRQDVYEAVHTNMKNFRWGLLVIAIALLIISFIQINNTTRLTIYARRFQIRTMSLVGATPGFIQRPIVWQSFLNGLWGGLIAVALLAVGIYLIQAYKMTDILLYLPIRDLIIMAAAIALLGILISVLTAYLAARRYIRMDGSKMHLI